MRQFGQGHTGVPMDSPLRLLLLHLTVALTVGGNDYNVDQPARLSAVEGGSVTLPCSFSYPAHLRPRGFDVAWRAGNFHGPTIFNLARAYTDRVYEGRITFLGSPDHDHTASIRLDRLRMRDSGRYICRVVILGGHHKVWQSITGTDLSVQALTVSGNGFLVVQPAGLSAAKGGSVTLPCSFSYPAHVRPRGFDVSWRAGNFHGPTIFNLAQADTDREYEGRITFLGSPDRDHTASIRLDRLRSNDSGRYYCQVMILVGHQGAWQSIQGTYLSVQAPTERPSVTMVVERTTPRGSPPWVLFVAKGGGLLLLGAGVVICICQRKRRRDCLGVVWSGCKGDPVTSGDKERRRADVEPRGDGQPAHHHAGEL